MAQRTPFARDLAAALGRPVRVANDADCFALSEAVDGAGAGIAMVFGVILGTGVGGGLVIDGRVWSGRNGSPANGGTTGCRAPDADDLPMPRCWCGRDGCIETYLSGPALLADHRARGGAVGSTPTRSSSGPRGRRRGRVATLRRYVRRLAKALATVVNVVDPDVIVLGGGLSNIDALYAACRR